MNDRFAGSPASRFSLLGLALLLAGQTPIQAADNAADNKTPPAAPTAPTTVGTIGTREPLIEVSVDSLEISEANVNTLGILWGTQATNGTGGLQNGQLNFVEQTVPSIFNIGTLNRSAISAQLDLLIQNNQARVLANPTLLTKSGFEANFAVGGEIPYPTVGQGGVQGVEYKKYGVTLKILPQITPRQTIEAQINVGVSAIDTSVAITLNGISVPGLSSREAGSKVEVKDGETVVLAGIKQSNRSKTVVRVPVLGYIPLIGLLFRHTAENVTQTSLVLFVTFRLVKN